MDGSAGKVTPRRRAFWLSLAALVLVLPASLAVRAKDSARAWQNEYSHTPIDAAIGQPVDYAGVEWTVTRLERLFSANGASIVLAVFEASGQNLKELAEAPCQVSLGDGEGRTTTPITAEQLLAPRRAEDAGDDLWRTFNRVQENAIRGGLTAWGRDAQNRPRRVSSREVTGIDGDVRLNRALWTLTERMAELKGVG